MAIGLLTLGALVKASVGPALVLAVVASAAARPQGVAVAASSPSRCAIAVGADGGVRAPYWQTVEPDARAGRAGQAPGVAERDPPADGGVRGIGETLWGATGRTAVEAVIRSSLALAAAARVALVRVALARRFRRMARLAGRDRAGAGRAWGWALLVTILASPVLFPGTWRGSCRWRGSSRAAGEDRGDRAGGLLSLTRAMAEPELVPGLYKVLLSIGHDVVGPVFLRVPRLGGGAGRPDRPRPLTPRGPRLLGLGGPRPGRGGSGEPSRDEPAGADED